MPLSLEEDARLTEKWDEYEKQQYKRQVTSAFALPEHERVADLAERAAHWNRMYRELLESLFINECGSRIGSLALKRMREVEREAGEMSNE